MSSLARWAPPLIAATVLALLVAVGDRELHTYHLHDILRSLASLSTGHLLAALALTVVGHLVHVGYDLLALRYAEHPLPVRRVAFGSLVAAGARTTNSQTFRDGKLPSITAYRCSVPVTGMRPRAPAKVHVAGRASPGPTAT